MLSLRPFLTILPLAVVLDISSSANGVWAQMPPVPESQQVLQQRLDALGKHVHGGSLPRWSNPDDQKDLRGMWDPALLGRPPYSADDVTALATMLKAQRSILLMYTGAGHATPGSPKEARVRTKYQEEIVRSSAFLLSTSAGLLQAIGEFVAKLKPEQLNAGTRKGFEEGRAGVRSLIESFDAELQLPDVTTESKAILLDALVANAETIAAYSPDEDRKRYVNAAKSVLPGLRDAEKTKLEAFITAMGTKTCKGLCTLRS